jgi:hypothetical protein
MFLSNKTLLFLAVFLVKNLKKPVFSFKSFLYLLFEFLLMDLYGKCSQPREAYPKEESNK